MPDRENWASRKLHRFRMLARSVVVLVAAQLNYLQASSVSVPPPRHSAVPLTFVTASDTSHAKSLVNLLTSISTMLPGAQVVVFDLGMTPPELQNLKATFPMVMVERFPYEEFPKYFDVRVSAGQYAWKAQCVERVAASSKGDLFWIDAGCVLSGQLKRIRKVLSGRGIFANRAIGPSSRWTHPLTFAALKAGGDTELRRDQLAATFIGFRLGNPSADCLISDWAHYSRDRNVIAPPGSSRDNHRQDQSVFSILMYAILAESTPKSLLNFVGYWPKTVNDYLTHQDVD